MNLHTALFILPGLALVCGLVVVAENPRNFAGWGVALLALALLI
jgi:hypothetical protein